MNTQQLAMMGAALMGGRFGRMGRMGRTRDMSGGFFKLGKNGKWYEKKSSKYGYDDFPAGVLEAWASKHNVSDRYRNSNNAPSGYFSRRLAPKRPLSGWNKFVQKNGAMLKGIKGSAAKSVAMSQLYGRYENSPEFEPPKASRSRAKYQTAFGDYLDPRIANQYAPAFNPFEGDDGWQGGGKRIKLDKYD
jgi:hypothetical protein